MSREDGCADATLDDYRYSVEEFRLLNGLKQIAKPTLILEGKILTEREIAYLMPADIRRLLY